MRKTRRESFREKFCHELNGESQLTGKLSVKRSLLPETHRNMQTKMIIQIESGEGVILKSMTAHIV